MELPASSAEIAYGAIRSRMVLPTRMLCDMRSSRRIFCAICVAPDAYAVRVRSSRRVCCAKGVARFAYALRLRRAVQAQLSARNDDPGTTIPYLPMRT
eukprot:3236796-Rhodomonas_salina.2